MRHWLYALVFALGAVTTAWSAETMPRAPTEYVTDYAHVMSSATVAKLNQELDTFERQTSNQVVVAVFPKMETDSSLEDYTHRILESWKVGQKNKNNGVGLFVFVADHKVRIEVNYGLEGALPDALSKRIIENEITPHFRNNDYDGGISAGVAAMEQAIRGEYKGNGSTVANKVDADTNAVAGVLGNVVMILFILFFAYLRFRSFRGATVYGSSGRSFVTGMLLGGMGGGWGGGGGGGWGGGGGGGGFSGGGFSGGGGSGGGGGASGSW